MKHIFLLVFACFLVGMAYAQPSTKKIKDLESQRNELQQQIAAADTLVQATKKDVKSHPSNLSVINGQIAERKKYIRAIEQDVNTLNR